jgi:hypothetical protein
VAQCAAGGGACQIGSATATCPEGFRAVGGGHISGGTTNIVLFSDLTGTQTYGVIAENESSVANNIKATANCVAGPGLTVISGGSRQPNIESLRRALAP